MRVDKGDLWTYPADLRCITTNGVVKADGRLVMGAGVAKQAAMRFPELPGVLGEHVRRVGNYPLLMLSRKLTSFPTKHHWMGDSDLELIRTSALKLVELLKSEPFVRRVVMTPPGCGLGRLEWAVVKEILDPILDDRFVVLINSTR